MTELMQEAIRATEVYRLKTKGTLYMAEAFCIRLADRIADLEGELDISSTALEASLDCYEEEKVKKEKAQASVVELREALGKITIETSDDVAFDIASKAIDSSTDAGKKS